MAIRTSGSSTDYLKYPSITIDGYWSACMWVRCDTSPTVYSMVLGIDNGTSGETIYCSGGTNPSNAWNAWVNGDASLNKLTPNYIPVAGEWLFIALSVRANATPRYGNFYLYRMSGGSFSTRIATPTGSIGGTRNLWVMNSGLNEFTQGRASNLKIWNRPLSISDLARERFSIPPINKVPWAWYPFEADYTKDHSGNNRTLTASGTIAVCSDPPVLWGKIRRKARFWVPAGAVTYNQACTATTVTSTSTYSRQINLIKPATTVTSSETISKQVGMIRSVTSTSVASAVKLIKMIRLVTSTSGSTSLTASKTYVKALIATTVTSVTSAVKQVNLIRSVTSTSTVTISKIQSLLRNLTATTVTSTVTVKRQINLIRNATTVTSNAVLVTSKAYARALIATTVTSVATVSKQVNMIRSVTSSSVVSAIKQVRMIRSVTSSSTNTAIKQINRIRTATTVTSTATVNQMKVLLRTLIANTVTSTATFTRQIRLIKSVTSTSVASYLRQIAKTFSVSVTGTATSVPVKSGPGATPKTLIATVTSIALLIIQKFTPGWSIDEENYYRTVIDDVAITGSGQVMTPSNISGTEPDENYYRAHLDDRPVSGSGQTITPSNNSGTEPDEDYYRKHLGE